MTHDQIVETLQQVEAGEVRGRQPHLRRLPMAPLVYSERVPDPYDREDEWGLTVVGRQYLGGHRASQCQCG